MNGRVDHVGIVTADTHASIHLYAHLLGLAPDQSLESGSEGVRITFLRPNVADGDATTVELIEPTRQDTGVARYLERRGEGLHHVCFEVDDIAAEMARLRDAGLEVLDIEPRRGAHGEKLAFVHPRSTRGVLIELYERGSRHR